MHTINVNGCIFNTNTSDVFNILKKILNPKYVKHKIKSLGESISYKDESLEFYLDSDDYRSHLTDEERLEMRVNGEFFTDSLEQVKSFLENLTQLLKEEKIKFQFDCYKLNETGDEIGECNTHLECLNYD